MSNDIQELRGILFDALRGLNAEVTGGPLASRPVD